MAATRRNIATNPADADAFVEAVTRLKNEPSGLSTTDLNITSGPSGPQPLSRWDLYPIWHLWAMQESFSNNERNAAHSGPVFLPWHRWFLLVLEFDMRRVLQVGPDDFGLPYWDWAADGALNRPQQITQPDLWDIVGGNGRATDGLLFDGPFGESSGFRVRVVQNAFSQLESTNRPLRRNFGNGGSRLPRQVEVDAALAEPTYDSSGWNQASLPSFRNLVEGWRPFNQFSQMHNRVHVWVGGDMGPGTSPNDPIFFLNHCFVDKLWADWQDETVDPTYLPGGTSPQGDPLFRHRAGDPILSVLTRLQPAVSAVQNVSQFYVYE